MKPFENFLDSSVGLQRIIEIYVKMRQYFQSEGWSERDLEKPPYYSPQLMSLHQNFGNELKDLLQQVKDYGLEIDREEFNEYLKPILSKIDEITPLSHGNHKRRNQGDEDY
jgi:nitrate reductase assembly molybdenum cofactor insertion protein NarJ